ncbi:hypothetical protein NPIL_257801 [Nephila pilipes]|uniref:Uncharacterized protein n=1 Tax=Nephila pilipes TaxID=299642 RepID=A0A8X6NCU6_NEPPI|nr:hypothetical protein NPIL_257801 [Nephila pilipes]
MLPHKSKSSESCPDLISKKVIVHSPLKSSFSLELRKDLLKNSLSDIEIMASKVKESKGGESNLQSEKGKFKPGGDIFENERVLSHCTTGGNIRQNHFLSSEERSLNFDYAEFGKQIPNVSRKETLHSANKYPKFLECNEQSCSASQCGSKKTQLELTFDVRDNPEQQITENNVNNDTNEQGRMHMDYSTPIHSRNNQTRLQNLPSCWNRSEYTSFECRGQFSQSSSSDTFSFSNPLPKPSICYTADQKQENIEDIYENYRLFIGDRRITRSNTCGQRTETRNWRSRISRLFHVMGERLRKVFSSR